ncbi:MAG: DUF4411 family protein [Pseudomonadota bacterium]
MAYLIDANVLIEAKNAHYQFSFCPAFWDWLVTENQLGNVFVIPRVLDEIAKGQDQLKNWCAVHPSLRAAPLPSFPQSLATVATWVTTQSYNANAVSEFLAVADYQLIAHAHATGDTVVTHEVATAQMSPKKVKIPEPCNALGVSFVSPYQMLATENAAFILDDPN